MDVGQLVGESALASGAAPLRHVFLMTSGEVAGATRVDLAARLQDASEFDARFSRTEGVEVLERRETAGLRAWRLRLDHARRPTEALADLFDGDRTVLFEKHWDTKPDFVAPPPATPVKRRVAAGLLGREMLNRRVGGAPLAPYGGNVAPLFLDLAGALRDVSCWRLRVGDIRDTAGLIERCIAEEPSVVAETRHG